MKKSILKELGAIDLTERFSSLAKYRVPTGLKALDLITEGGIPSGKLTEINGGWVAGKSRLLCHILAETQRMGGLAIFVDIERSLEKGLVQLTGLDIDNLIYPDPNNVETVEEVFDLLHKSIVVLREENPDGLLVFGWDSLAATGTREDLNMKDLGSNTAGMRRAKVIDQGLKKHMPEIYKNNVAFVVVNQLRDKIDVMFGDKTDTPGGKAVKFWASLRIKMSLSEAIKDEKTEDKIGYMVRIAVEKSKVGIPFRVINVKMLATKPMDPYAGLLDYLVRHEEAVKHGAGWYSFPNEDTKFREDEFSALYEKRSEKEKPDA